MKIALCVYRLPGSPTTLRGWRRNMEQAQLLRRRANTLAQEGHQPVVLGQTENLLAAVAQCRAAGAQGLWITCQSPMGGLRYEYLREPGRFAGLSLFVDGLVSPDLPPTAGQLARLASMGFCYLPQGKLSPGDLALGGIPAGEAASHGSTQGVGESMEGGGQTGDAPILVPFQGTGGF